MIGAAPKQAAKDTTIIDFEMAKLNIWRIGFTSKKILQYAVILLGFGMNFKVILAKGIQSLPIIIITITTSLVVAFLFYKLAETEKNITTLIGVGSSICGGSAIAATAPIIKAKDSLDRKSVV